MPKQYARTPATLNDYLLVFVNEVAGVSGLKIVTGIGDGATDESIESSTKLKIAEVRSILNHLHSYGIVEYVREKNLSSGWFTYTWRVNINRAMQNFLVKKKRDYETTKARLRQGSAYKCTSECSIFSFDDAVDYKFKCPQCKNTVSEINPSEILKRIGESITGIEKIIKSNNANSL